MRTLPLDLSAEYARAHDDAMKQTLSEILNRPEIVDANDHLHALCTMKHSHGGLGLRSAVRTAPAAYWASFADTIPEICKRFPYLSRTILGHLDQPQGAPHALSAASDARQHLINIGYSSCPSWQDINAGLRPPPIHDIEAGEWAHG